MALILGQKKQRTPAENHFAQERLIQACKKQKQAGKQYSRPEPQILKFQTWQDLHQFNLQRAARKL